MYSICYWNTNIFAECDSDDFVFLLFVTHRNSHGTRMSCVRLQLEICFLLYSRLPHLVCLKTSLFVFLLLLQPLPSFFATLYKDRTPTLRRFNGYRRHLSNDSFIVASSLVPLKDFLTVSSGAKEACSRCYHRRRGIGTTCHSQYTRKGRYK